MSTEQTASTPAPPPGGPPDQPAEWGAPPPPAGPKSKWTTKRVVIAVAVAVGIAAAGGVAIYAASGSVDNTQNGAGGPGGRMVMGGPFGVDGTQHGEFQVGEVTELSSDEITVKSEDGYEKTYAIDGDTEKTDGIAEGDEVTVIASTADGTATADSILEFGTGPGGNRRDGGGPMSDGNLPEPNGGN